MRRSRDGSCRPLLHLTTVATDNSVLRREKDVCSPVVSNVCVVVLPVVITLVLCKSVSLSVYPSVHHAPFESGHTPVLHDLQGFWPGAMYPIECCIEYDCRSSHPAHFVCHIWREHYSCYCNR